MIQLADFEIRHKDYLDAVIRSGRLTYGPYSKMFEEKFSAIHDCDYGLFMNSGTSALQIALQTLKELHGWADGSKVVVPALTFVAGVNIVLHCRLEPILCDVDPITLNMCPDALGKVLSKNDGVVCIIPTHIMGRPCDMDGILSQAQGLHIIEDSCETVFTKTGGDSVGSWGDIGCFSTYAAHTLTSGVGGFATTNDPEYANYMRSLMNHGRDTAYIDYDDKSPDWNTQREIVEVKYRFPRIGHSYRATEMEAAIGLGQLEDKDEIKYKRMAVMVEYNRSYWGGSDLVLPFKYDEGSVVPMMYPIICPPGKRTSVRDALEQAGVETRDIVQILHQPCYSGMWNPEDYPHANRISRDCLLVPCHQKVSQGDVELIVDVASKASLK